MIQECSLCGLAVTSCCGWAMFTVGTLVVKAALTSWLQWLFCLLLVHWAEFERPVCCQHTSPPLFTRAHYWKACCSFHGLPGGFDWHSAYLSVVKFCHGYSILKNRAYSLCSQLRGLVEGTTDVLECRVTSLLPQGRNHFRVVFVLFHTAAGCIRATLEGFLPSHGGWVKVGLQGNAEMGHRVLVHTLKVLELAPACIWLSGLGGWQEKYHPPVLLFLKNFLKIPAPPTHVLKISQ